MCPAGSAKKCLATDFGTHNCTPGISKHNVP